MVINVRWRRQGLQQVLPFLTKSYRFAPALRFPSGTALVKLGGNLVRTHFKERIWQMTA